MSQRIVVALGGNALGKNLTEQYHAVRETAKVIVDLIADGNQVVIAHGNGPQVGMIQSAMTELTKMDPVKYPLCPLPVCVAMSQGYIGYDLQRALGEALQARELTKPVSTVLTQVEVDPADPAFQHPTKPIGSFMTREEAEALAAQGFAVMEDAGRGYRRVVASPRPKAIVELETIRALMEAGQVVVACGGGGIPVSRAEDGSLHGAEAVIDKDFAAELLAESLDADLLIILTAVEQVAVGADPGGSGSVHSSRRIRTRLHAAQGGGRRPLRPLRPGPDRPHHRAAKSPGRHRRRNRHAGAGSVTQLGSHTPGSRRVPVSRRMAARFDYAFI